MKTPLAFNDYLLMSAYIDGQCSDRDIAQVESRLENDAEFRQALAEFKREKKILKAIPQVKAPHNFTLSAAKAPAKPQRFFLARSLNFAAVALAVVFVALFAGSRLLPLFSTTSKTESSAPLIAAAPANLSAEATSAPLITWGHPGGMGGGSDNSSAQGLGGGAPAPQTKSFGAGNAPEVQPTVGVADATPEATTDTSNLILGLPGASDRGKETFPGQSPEPANPKVPWLLIGEITSAALATALAITSWLMRRRH